MKLGQSPHLGTRRPSGISFAQAFGWFEVQAIRTEGHLIWPGGGSSKGYGTFNYDRHTYKAHVVAYQIHCGAVPPGMQVDHTCHVQMCIEPAHLRLVTNKQNQENLSGPHRRNRCGVRGVYFRGDGRPRPWLANVRHHGRLYQAAFVSKSEARRWAVAKRCELFTHNDGDRCA